MRRIEDSHSSEALTTKLFDAEKSDEVLPTQNIDNKQRTRERNMQKLQTYSKSIAQVSLHTRTERKLRQKASLIDQPQSDQMQCILQEINQEYSKLVQHLDFLKVSEKSVIGGFTRNDIF